MSQSLASMYNGVVTGTGSALQATLFGVHAGKGMNEILTGFILDETGISTVLDLASSIRSFFGGDHRADEVAEIAAFFQHFDSYVLPLLMGMDTTELEEVNEAWAASSMCLVAGTLVDTADGLREIEAIRGGDQVWAWNEQTGQRELRRVVDAFTAHREDFVVIEVDGVTITATIEHPFLTQAGKWKRADELAEGEALFDDGEAAGKKIASLQRFRVPTIVYNMEVEGLHNYFVTAEGVLTHNAPAGFHHFYPKAFARFFNRSLDYGERALGAKRYLDALQHTEIHRDLNAWLRNYSSNGTRMNLLPRRNWPGKRLMNDFTPPVVEQALREFYQTKYSSKPHFLEMFEEELKLLREMNE
jgi:hypothetical protein